MAKITMVQAINLALRQEMEKDDRVLVLGQDVGKDEGVFRVTSELLARFGDKRVIDTPLAEAAIVGVSIGMAVYGLRPVAEIQFHGFDYQAFHQIEQHMARFRHRSQGRFSVPMVMRAPSAGGVRALEHHSESREAYYAHTPGLKVVMPSGPRNARALLIAAIRDPDPVIYLEPKSLYRAFREEVPDEEETMPLGKAQVVREGKDITLVSYGAMMRPTLEAATILKDKDGVEAEVIDLLTVSPLDTETFAASVLKTGRCVVVNEAPRSFGPAAEVVTRLVEKDFWYLEAPIRRVTGFDVIMPLYAREKAYLPGTERVLRAAREALEA
jgi:pyruvate dehydrogenase E1 component beta subunit